MKQFCTLSVILLALIFSVGNAAAQKTDAFDQAIFDQATTLLVSKKFSDKSRAVDLLSKDGSEKSQALLSALLEGNLFYLKADKRLLFAEKEGKGYLIRDALTDASLGSVGKRKVKKITVNNTMRGDIRASLAVMNLKHPDAEKRLAAVNQLLDRPEAGSAELLQPLLAEEKDGDVREAMATVIAIQQLQSEDAAQQLAAIESLKGNIHPAVRNNLRALQESTEDKALSDALRKALQQIESKLQFYSLIENLFFGLSLGSVLVLAAIGLAITFGVMGVINMAHGELIMIGAYTTYVIQLLMPEHIGLSIFIAIPAAFVVSGLVGIAIERGVIRFLYGRPLETLLATFGISLILQQTVRSIFSPLNRSVETPAWMSGIWEINSALSITYNRLYILLFCLLVFLALLLVLKKTSLGLQVRAVSQNRSMARAMGVRSERVDAMTFGLGSGIAGIAGVALSQLTNVGPNLGQAYIVDSFMVVVFGGVGNLWGTLVSGMSLGVANKFLEPWSGAVLAKILVLVFIILFIQKRPRGLFPQKGRAAEG